MGPKRQTFKTRVWEIRILVKPETFYPWLTEFVIFEEATLNLGVHQINDSVYAKR